MDQRIDELQRQGAATPGVIGLGGGLPAAAQFPRAALARAFLHAVNRPEAPALQYGWPEGLQSLSTRIAERLRDRGADVDPANVLITNGAQQAIALASELTCRPGARIWVSAETYPAALDLFSNHRLQAVTSPAGAAAAYAMPALSNPWGRALTADERRALLSSRLPILEDDAYADLRFDGPADRPLLAEAPSRVLHIGTFSKTLCPGLRVGYLVVPPRMRSRALRLKHGGDLQPSSLSQEIVDHYLATVDFDRRLTTLRRFYRGRARRLTRALARLLPGWRFQQPEGGFALWVLPDDQVDEVAFLELAIDHGVSFDPGSMFRPGREVSPTAMRLAFSFADSDDLEIGVERLAKAWRARSRLRRLKPDRGAARRAPRDRSRTAPAESPLRAAWIARPRR